MALFKSAKQVKFATARDKTKKGKSLRVKLDACQTQF